MGYYSVSLSRMVSDNISSGLCLLVKEKKVIQQLIKLQLIAILNTHAHTHTYCTHLIPTSQDDASDN